MVAVEVEEELTPTINIFNSNHILAEREELVSKTKPIKTSYLAVVEEVEQDTQTLVVVMVEVTVTMVVMEPLTLEVQGEEQITIHNQALRHMVVVMAVILDKMVKMAQVEEHEEPQETPSMVGVTDQGNLETDTTKLTFEVLK